MDYETRYVTSTPEGVNLDVVLAGLGSRLAAYLLDFLIQGVLLLVFARAGGAVMGRNPTESASLIGGGVFIAFAALDFVFYFVICEAWMHGRSIGKLAAGLRVVRTNGQPVGFLASLLRNLLRVVDFLPGFYAVGAILIITTPRQQRLGDLVASTLVVRVRVAAEAGVSASAFESGAAFGAAPVTGWSPSPWQLPPELAGWDVSAVPVAEIALARTFLANRQGYTPEARWQLANQLAGRVWPYVAGPAGVPDPEMFLEMVLQVKAARG